MQILFGLFVTNLNIKALTKMPLQAFNKLWAEFKWH